MGLIALKRQDVVILLKIVALGNKEWMNYQLAEELGICPSEISCSLERCRIAKLIDNTKKRVNILSFQDFMIHGLKYVYPPLPGAITRGMPTAFSAKSHRDKTRMYGHQRTALTEVKRLIPSIALFLKHVQKTKHYMNF